MWRQYNDNGYSQCFWGGRFFMGQSLVGQAPGIIAIANDFNISYNNFAFASFDTGNPESSNNGGYDATGGHYIRAKVNWDGSNTNAGYMYYKIYG